MPSSPTTENYLKAIYALSERHPERDRVRPGDLAGELNITPGTVTTMLQALAERGLVNYVIRRGAVLTEKGRIEALQVLRRHRLIELFLVQVMNMDWSEVHQDAEALEHAVSDQLVERMDAMLGHPTLDPHGDPIPDMQSIVPDTPGLPLPEVQPGPYRVSRVNDQNPDFLAWMDQAGLRPGVQVELIQNESMSGAMVLRVVEQTETLPISRDIARNIHVEPLIGC